MGLFSGLEKFGLGKLEKMDVFEEEKKRDAVEHPKKDQKPQIQEEDLLFDKSFTCPVCDEEFHSKMVRTGKVKLLSADSDLRPKYQMVDSLKYDALVCPHCGYAALSRFFKFMLPAQAKMIRENITANFKGIDTSASTYSYDDAIMRHQLALANAVVKKAKTSEKAYTCLKMALQPNTPVGTFVCSQKSIGFDGLLNFYAGRNAVCDLPFERAFLNHMGWSGNMCAPAPYVIDANEELIDRIAKDDMVRGVTIAAGGFFGPQGRELRIPLADPKQNDKIEAFEYKGYKITNFEMESSALAGLSRLMGHKAMTVCMVIANRLIKEANTGYKNTIDTLIKTVLDRI